MARAFSVSGVNGTGAATKTILGVTGAAAARSHVFDIILGSAAAPADQSALYTVTRSTAAGTSTAFTPLLTDPADTVVATSTAGITHTVEPTYAATDLLQIPLNQRASFRWVASPGYELINTLSATNGLGLRLLSATASMVEYGTVFFFE